jgi:hypothetical protein
MMEKTQCFAKCRLPPFTVHVKPRVVRTHGVRNGVTVSHLTRLGGAPLGLALSLAQVH